MSGPRGAESSGGGPGERAEAQVRARALRAPLPLVVWVLGAVAFLMGTSELIVVGLLPEFAATFRIPTADAGLLVTVFALGMMVGAPIMSLATLRVSRRTALLAALLAFAAAQIVIAVSSLFALTLLARFIAAAANGTFWAVGAVVVTAAVGAGSSARAMSVMVSGFTLSNVVGAPLGTVLGQALGWPGPFVVLAVLALAATALVVKQVPANRVPHTDIRSAVRSETAALRRPSLWLIYAATALIPGGLLATYSYVAPLLIEGAHLPADVVPLGLLSYGLGALAGVALAGRWGDRRPFVVLVSAVGVLVSVQLAMALWGGNGLVVIALLVVLGAAGLVVNPVLVALVVRATGGEQHARRGAQHVGLQPRDRDRVGPRRGCALGRTRPAGAAARRCRAHGARAAAAGCPRARSTAERARLRDPSGQATRIQEQMMIPPHRLGEAVLTVLGDDGRPIADTEVMVEQQWHAFGFGNIGFDFVRMIGGDDPEGAETVEAFGGSAELDLERYAAEWLRLFNTATLPFYWGRYEPRRGRPDRDRLERTRTSAGRGRCDGQGTSAGLAHRAAGLAARPSAGRGRDGAAGARSRADRRLRRDHRHSGTRSTRP